MRRGVLQRRIVAAVLSLAGLTCDTGALQAIESGKATIYLIDTAGTEHAIGSVTFSPSAGRKSGIAVTVDGSQFSDQFLSMRPFRCIEGPQEWYCHLPYPYALSNTVSKDDFGDLEYSLLFIRKTPQEFGIDAWNGLYWKLEEAADGSIAGTLFEGDLNVLASPPSSGETRPIDLNQFQPADAAKRLFPRLVIR